MVVLICNQVKSYTKHGRTNQSKQKLKTWLFEISCHNLHNIQLILGTFPKNCANKYQNFPQFIIVVDGSNLIVMEVAAI